jgi:hypothetical protein
VAADPVEVGPAAVELEVVVAGLEAPVAELDPVAAGFELAAAELELELGTVAAGPVEPPAPAAAAEAASWALSCAENPAGSGAWMLAIARPMFPPLCADRNATPVGAGMTIPAPAASRSIR